MLTPTTAQDIIDSIQYKDWELRTNLPESGEDWWMQWRFMDLDNMAEDPFPPQLQSCRKWKLSPHMTPSEIVRTCFKAALVAEEHEASEKFTFKGTMVFNPHRDILALEEAVAGGTVGEDYRV
jgi:hypothetical protein